MAAEKAGWGKPLPAGHGRGIAVVNNIGSFTAEVAETGFSAPRAGGGDIERLAMGFFAAAAVTEFEDPGAEAGETFE